MRSFSFPGLALLVDHANNLVIVAPNRRDLSTEYRAGALNIIGSFGHNYSIDHHPVGLLNITWQAISSPLVAPRSFAELRFLKRNNQWVAQGFLFVWAFSLIRASRIHHLGASGRHHSASDISQGVIHHSR